MFLIRDVFLLLILILLYHCVHCTGAAQILSQALLKVLLEGIQVNLELRILGLVLNLYTPLFRGVVQGFGQGCSWAEDESSVAGATFTMLPSFSLGNNPYSPWSFNGNPICVRGLAREKLVFPQGCRLSQDESSLSFTMLLRLESLFPFSFSPPLAGGNIANVRRYSPRFCLLWFASLPDSWDSGFLRLGSLLWPLWASGLHMVSWTSLVP